MTLAVKWHCINKIEWIEHKPQIQSKLHENCLQSFCSITCSWGLCKLITSIIVKMSWCDWIQINCLRSLIFVLKVQIKCVSDSLSLSRCRSKALLLSAGFYLCFVYVLGQHDFKCISLTCCSVYIIIVLKPGLLSQYSLLRVVACADCLDNL